MEEETALVRGRLDADEDQGQRQHARHPQSPAERADEPKARELLISFRSYMMAAECDFSPSSAVMNRVKRMFTPWLAGK